MSTASLQPAQFEIPYMHQYRLHADFAELLLTVLLKLNQSSYNQLKQAPHISTQVAEMEIPGVQAAMTGPLTVYLRTMGITMCSATSKAAVHPVNHPVILSWDLNVIRRAAQSMKWIPGVNAPPKGLECLLDVRRRAGEGSAEHQSYTLGRWAGDGWFTDNGRIASGDVKAYAIVTDSDPQG